MYFKYWPSIVAINLSVRKWIFLLNQLIHLGERKKIIMTYLFHIAFYFEDSTSGGVYAMYVFDGSDIVVTMQDKLYSGFILENIP